MKILKTNQNEVDKKVIDEAVKKFLVDLWGYFISYRYCFTVWELIFFNRKSCQKSFNIKKKKLFKPVSLF